jgi:TRAP-type C4-dicarboxylate transport system permease large subunit
MPSRHLAPPPEKVTWADLYRIGLGLLMILLGITILVRTISGGIITPASVLIGAAFIAFGAYRLYVGTVRYRMYRNAKRKE